MTEVSAVQQTVEIVTACINEVGFPIVIVGVLLYMMWQERKSHAEESKQHVAAVEACKTAIENNTTMLMRIMEKLGG